MAGNHNNPTAQTVEDYQKMVSLLDADPANMDPANPNNALQMYREGYMFIMKYYQDNDNKEEVSKYNDLLKEVLARQEGQAQN